MSLSKADDIKNRMKKRDARSSLMGNAVTEEEINKNVNDNVNNNEDENINNDVDIHHIINKRANAKSVKELVGIYFDPEVKKALDKLQRAEGRGAKSELVNDITKWALQQKGLL
jgi:hypothetical protein